MSVHEIIRFREGDGEGGEIGSGNAGSDGQFGGYFDVDLVPDAGREDMIEEGSAAFDQERVDVA